MTDSNDSPDDIASRIASSVREQLQDDESSRRSFLGKTALAGGGLVALGGGAGLTLADEDEDDPGEMMADFDDVEGTDLDVLNYALTLEHLEDAFYQEGIEMFGESDYANSEALQDAPDDASAEVHEYVQTVGEHESTHVDALTQAVELLGGEPEARADYEFGVENADQFLATAATLENVGVSAYVGAAPFIESPDLVGVAASILGVEARHAAVLNDVIGEPPFPNAFDPGRSQQEVLEAAGPFFANDTNGSDGDMGNETTTTGNETTTTGNETTTEDGH